LAPLLKNAHQGDIVNFSNFDIAQCKALKTKQVFTGGKLIFSDSPEYAPTPGRTYEDSYVDATIFSPNRIFAYHVNGKSSGLMKFSVLIQNLGIEDGYLQVVKSGIAGPSEAYINVGRYAFLNWMESTGNATVTVKPREFLVLDPKLEKINVAPNQLIHGLYDYFFSQPHRVIICALNIENSSISVCPNLPILKRSSSQTRGTFAYADVIMTAQLINTRNGVQYFQLVGGKSGDLFIDGFDRTDGTSVTNNGNYGVVYYIHIPITEPSNVAFLFNPRGGTWGGAISAQAGIEKGGKFLLPGDQECAYPFVDAVVEGKYNVTSVSNIFIEFMPTGAAAFPLFFTIVPSP